MTSLKREASKPRVERERERFFFILCFFLSELPSVADVSFNLHELIFFALRDALAQIVYRKKKCRQNLSVTPRQRKRVMRVLPLGSQPPLSSPRIRYNAVFVVIRTNYYLRDNGLYFRVAAFTLYLPLHLSLPAESADTRYRLDIRRPLSAEVVDFGLS